MLVYEESSKILELFVIFRSELVVTVLEPCFSYDLSSHSSYVGQNIKENK